MLEASVAEAGMTVPVSSEHRAADPSVPIVESVGVVVSETVEIRRRRARSASSSSISTGASGPVVFPEPEPASPETVHVEEFDPVERLILRRGEILENIRITQ